MKIITKYLIKRYIKLFFVILLSLELFFVGIDFIQEIKFLPKSANLQILYILYNSFFTLSIVLPLSLIFSWVALIISLINNNEFIAFYSVGATKKHIIRPVIFIVLLFTIILIALQSTPLAYSKQQKQKISRGEYFSNSKKNIFLKYNDYFVYFKKLLPIEQKAQGIYIYSIKNGDVVEIITADTAYFVDNKWYALNTKTIKKPTNIDWNSSITIVQNEFLNTLDGFKPKILDNVYSTRTNYSVFDGIQAWILLKKQGLDTQLIRSKLYYNVFVPFFVIPTIILIFLYSSVSARFFSINKFSSIAILLTLSSWGFLFFLSTIAAGSLIIPEVSLLLPLVLLYIFAYKQYIKKSEII